MKLRQTKLYQCVRCWQNYLHDDAHHHAVFFCQERNACLPCQLSKGLVRESDRPQPAALA